MAITRAQIAKQLLAQGGRTGFQGGGADAATTSFSQSFDKQMGNEPGTTKGNPELDRREKEGQAQADAANRRIELNRLARLNQEEKLEEKLEKFRNLGSKTRQFQNYLSKLSPVAMFVSQFGPLNTRDFFAYNVLDAGRFKYNDKTLTKEEFAKLSEEEKADVYKDYMSARSMGEIDAYGNPITKSGDGPDPIPFIPPVVSEPEIKPEPGYVNPLSLLTPRIAGTRFLGTEFEDEDKAVNLRLAGGGIASLDDMDREGFLLGGIAKGLKKAVRGIKKLAKSPIGKAAIAAAAIKFGGGLSGLRGTLFGQAGSRVGQAFVPFKQGLFTKLGLTQGGGSLMPTALGGITLASTLAGAMTPKEGEDKFDLAKYYGDSQLEPSQSIRGMGSEFDFYGGERMRVAEGGSTEKEPVAKKTMPLLDMDGMEKDYREEGGFVPIGRMEKADDVPARLSKNEFVFTADAVRNAGDGDVDKGAEVMYNMMKNLESGGDVSEESQGLEGAREMFQTSKRLEEVL